MVDIRAMYTKTTQKNKEDNTQLKGNLCNVCKWVSKASCLNLGIDNTLYLLGHSEKKMYIAFSQAVIPLSANTFQGESFVIAIILCTQSLIGIGQHTATSILPSAKNWTSHLSPLLEYRLVDNVTWPVSLRYLSIWLNIFYLLIVLFIFHSLSTGI